MNPVVIAAVYLAVINLIAAILAAIDKRRAQKARWRIPEKTLLFIGFAGGALGEYTAMKALHHKTKHAKFMVGLPLVLFFHIVIIIFIIYKAAF